MSPRRARSRPAPPPEVLWRDPWWLVLAKPAWLPTTSPDAEEPTLAVVARELAGSTELVHPTSRLDTGVTGVVTFALSRAANEAALAARASGRYRRTYLALASDAGGGLPADEGAWAWPVAPHPQDPKRRVAVTEPGRVPPHGVEARTQFRVVARAAGVALLALHPRTGRTHQLRVHAAAAGAALLGDAAYGGLRRLTLPDGTVVGCPRPALHCARVTLEAGAPVASLDVRSAVPADLRAIWTALGGEPLAWERALEEPAGSPT